MGWCFWDVKGGFQNVCEKDVIRELEKSEEGIKWITWVRGFFRARRFEVEGDGRIRGGGKRNLRGLQGSPLSPIIFLIWIAPIMRKMESSISEVVPYNNEFPSYVDDLHVGYVTRTRSMSTWDSY